MIRPKRSRVSLGKDGDPLYLAMIILKSSLPACPSAPRKARACVSQLLRPLRRPFSRTLGLPAVRLQYA